MSFVDPNLTGSRYNVLNRGLDGVISYSNGPARFGLYPSSGSPYTGYWVAWFNPNTSTVNVKSVSYIGAPVTVTDAGTSLPFFPAVTLSDDPSNVSLAFDNSGQAFLGIQDNSTTPPTIRVAGWSGAYQQSWPGYNPIVFNAVEVFTGFYGTGNLASIQTGNVGCLYTNSDSTQFYSRYQADSFSTEYPFSLGGTTGYFLWLAGPAPVFFPETPPPIGDIAPYTEEIEQGMITISYNLVGYETAVSGLTLVTYLS